MIDQRTAADGTALATYHWPVTARRASIVIVHGLAEHIGRYEHMARLFRERGFDVRGSDLRGFGRSGGRRAYVNRWDEYLDDLAGNIADAAGGGPVVLYGHSMGALISLTYMLSDRPRPDLAVLSAPWLDDDVPRLKKLGARLLAPLFPRLSVANGIEGDQLCHDPTVGEEYAADPLAHHKTTLALGRAVLAAQESARASLGSLDVPTLLLHGEEDTLVPLRATNALGEVPSVDRRVLPGLRHETHNEDGGVAVAALIADWIDGRL